MVVSEPVHFTPARSHRFHFLDALRGIAAILVCVFHIPRGMRPLIPVPNGFLAVDFFYCLSGFVIAYAYEQRLREGLALKDFFVARLIRLYPLYLLGTLVGLASVLLSPLEGAGTVTHLNFLLVVLSSLLMLPNLMIHWPVSLVFPLNAPGWSLFFELAVNALFSAMVRLKSASNRIVGVLMLGAGAMLLLLVPGGGLSFNVGADTPSFCWGFPRVGYSFFAGILIFRLYQSASTPRRNSSVLVPLSLAVGLMAVLLASSTWAQSIYFQLLSMFLIFPAIVYFGAFATMPVRLHKLCARLGTLSYPLYILHFPLLRPLDGRRLRALLAHHPSVAHLVLPAMCIGLAVFVWIADKAWDVPIRKWLTSAYDRHRLQTMVPSVR